ncbi:hypothetical protein L873DRAFT_1663417, partial [Choiromyces venosus 120613-1]
DKRQALLILCVFMDGIPQVPPMIIFWGKGKCLHDEKPQYHPGILVKFNDKVYMNNSLFLCYIKNYLIPVLSHCPTLFMINLMGSHKTSTVLEKLRSHNITLSLILTGCTSLVQPLDSAINKPFKDLMCEQTDHAIFAAENISSFHKYIVKQWHILITSCVGDVFYKFHEEKSDIIYWVFWKVCLSLLIDGSADSELHIKGFMDLDIGDWRDDIGMVPQEAEILDTNDDNENIQFI